MDVLEHTLSPDQKALALNLDPLSYGSFAEIGAGQEVVRYFFRVGGAAGTVAKSISAYDMAVSDAIYGKEANGRYVCKSRLEHMLSHEYDSLTQCLWTNRASKSRFFAFANTVAIKSFSNKSNWHGWLGIRFQEEPETDFSQIIIHVRLLENDIHAQQQALGIVGVNLIHAAFYNYEDPDRLIQSLMDNLQSHQLEIDLIETIGPAFHHINNTILCLKLVEKNYTPAIIFDVDGHIAQAADALYKRSVLIQRGSFRPVTYVNMNMQECAHKHFLNEPGVKEEKHCLLMEITLENLKNDKFDHSDFIDRIHLLNALGYQVMISNFKEDHLLARFVRLYTQKLLVLVLGIEELTALVTQEKYRESHLTVFQALAEIIGKTGKIYIFPAFDEKHNKLITSESLAIDKKLLGLIDYCRQSHFIYDMVDCDISKLHIRSKDVLNWIQSNDPRWESMVPPKVAAIIRQKALWQH